MKLTKNNIAFHPFFLSAYAVLFLLSYNVSQLPLVQVVRPLTITLVVALLLTLLFGRLTKNYYQGALSASLILLLFFSYGHVYHFLETSIPVLANDALLGPLWLVLLALGMLFKWRLRNLKEVTNTLNICTAALLVLPALQIAWFVVQSGGAMPVKQESPLDNLATIAAPNADVKSPDIYYIIVDAYTRADILQELYHYDNSAFIDYLKGRGFYVADSGRSNYIQTALSLSSSLNLKYINDLNESLGDNYQSRDPLAELIQHSALRKFLEQRGYKTIAFANAHGYQPTTIADADIFIDYKPRITNDLEALLLTSSAMRVFGKLDEGSFGLHDCRDFLRGGIFNIIENLKKVPEVSGTKFVFAHIISPHPPFIFGANGEPVENGPCSPADDMIGKTDYNAGYAEQVAFLNKMLKEVVEQILSKSATPPVIIIQGDHGSGMLLDFSSSANTCLHERTSIFNAYYLPGDGKKDLYASITPVNSFRIVLNNYFGANLPLLEDRSYYSGWNTPYKFEDVTNRIEAQCKLP
jgi:hypothetical protein